MTDKTPMLTPMETLQARIDYAFHIKKAGIKSGSEDDVKAICKAIIAKALLYREGQADGGGEDNRRI
ncbi:hypothetical protein LCGC14_1649630 [marine sediment metagenome]|uniref:Uncharacterized protein n=1 Tax=marine sediment metagenome TaxID=412755 RepID=A0A0F9HX90_9ZZZZ